APGGALLRRRIPARLPPAYLPQAPAVLGTRLRDGRRHGPAAGRGHSHRHPLVAIVHAGNLHRPVPRRGRRLVPVPPAGARRPVPGPGRRAAFRRGRPVPGAGRPGDAGCPAGGPAGWPGPAELAAPPRTPAAEPAQGAGTGGPPTTARVPLGGSAPAHRRPVGRGRPASGLASHEQPVRGGGAAVQSCRPDPARRLPADRAPGLGAAQAQPPPVAGRGVPPGIHPEPELLSPPGVRRRRARPPDRPRQPAPLALARRAAGAAGRRRRTLSTLLGGPAPARRPIVLETPFPGEETPWPASPS